MFRLSSSRALVAAAGLWCLAATSGCPKDDDEPGTAGSGGDTVEAGKGGSTAGAGQSGAGQAGKAGGSTTAGQGGTSAGTGGKTGTGGKPAAGTGGKASAGTGGSGGQTSGSDDDAGVPARRCGTRGGVMCDADEFCDFEPDQECGATDKGGLCEAKPEVCTDIYKPVCGCDSHSYGNECEAHGAGISVKHDGACTAEECQAIGGRTELSNGGNTPLCAAGETSFRIAGTKDGGLCCLPPEPGQGSGKTCGGFGGLSCAGANEFCNYEKSAGGQGCDGTIADASGVCQAQPSACTREYNPVCTCDTHTYATACTAHADGKSVLHAGACTVSDCAARGGRVEVGIGPGPMCRADETELTDIVNDDGSVAIEGMLCCLKK